MRTVRLLAEVDEAYDGMSGLATCAILRRQFEVRGDQRFVRLAGLSRSHLYNLRASRPFHAHNLIGHYFPPRRPRRRPG